ncbi:hypothetical protein HDV01_006584 [Terramyces sp. JEL0728]|nr:hypothetical protein HDV01_006584 [Terramyces sp. JEL0728]
MLPLLFPVVNCLQRLQFSPASITETHYGSLTLPVGTIGIGSPQQTISVLIQTESNLTWVRYDTDRCSSNVYSSGTKFSPTSSSTFVNLTPIDKDGNEHVKQLLLNNGTVDIERIKETVTFGDSVFANATIGGGCNFDGSSPDLFQYSSGSLGLAPGSSDISRIISSGEREKVMSLWYNRTAGAAVSGELIVGGFDNTKYFEPISWIPSSTPDNWNFPLDIVIGDQKIASNLMAGIYSGATLISVPTDIFNAITRNMNLQFVSNQYIFKSCLDTNDLQPIKFVIGNFTLILPHDQQFYYNPPSCIFNFAPRNESSIALGSLFLRHFYLAMNYGNSSIGFAVPSDNFTMDFQGASSSPFISIFCIFLILIHL